MLDSHPGKRADRGRGEARPAERRIGDQNGKHAEGQPGEEKTVRGAGDPDETPDGPDDETPSRHRVEGGRAFHHHPVLFIPTPLDEQATAGLFQVGEETGGGGGAVGENGPVPGDVLPKIRAKTSSLDDQTEVQADHGENKSW